MIDYERLLFAIGCGFAGATAICGPAFIVFYAAVRSGGETWKEFWDSLDDKWPREE